MVVSDGAVVLMSSAAVHDYGPASRVGPISLHVGGGEIVGLIGRNGSGKSTFLQMCAGLVQVDSGSICVEGQDVVRGSLPKGCAGFVNEPVFMQQLSARDNLTLAAAGRQPALGRVAAALSECGLVPADRRPLRHYSQGMRKRAAIARSLLTEPRLLLLDEPHNGLDPEGVAWLNGLLTTLASRGSSILVAAHQLESVQEIARKVVILRNGEVLRAGDLDEMLSESDSLHDIYLALDE